MTVLDQKLVVRSDADETHVKEVAGFVNGKIQEVLDRTKSASTLHAALLTCLNVADDLFRSREASRKITDLVAQEVRGLMEQIELEKNGPSL